MTIKLKRIYEQPAASDGFRVLIDRLWPRGISKERAALDAWLKEVAPSTELRQWFAHDPKKFNEFKLKYQTELAGNSAAAELVKLAAKHRCLTLLYAARDPALSHAVVLKSYLFKLSQD